MCNQHLVSSETELFLSVQSLPGYTVISWYLDHYNYFLVSGRIIKIIVQLFPGYPKDRAIVVIMYNHLLV